MANEKKFIVKNGLVTQNISFVDYIGDEQNTINLTMTNGDVLSFSGDSGSLFSILDKSTGTIFSFEDVSGAPSLEIEADGTLKLAGGSGNILIGTDVDDGVNKVQINGNIAVTGTVDGRDVAEDGIKLDSIENNANNYSLPVATSSILGGVKSGTDVTIDSSGNISVNDDSHNHLISNVDNLQTELDEKELKANKGVANGYASLDSNVKVPLAQLPDISKQATYVVLDATERNALTGLIEGDKTFETSTGDSYIYDGTAWVIMADADWENVNIDWTNLVNGPSSTPVEIDGAVDNSHTHSNKIILDAITDEGSGEIITEAERDKLAGIEEGAEVNNISDVNVTDLTDGGATTLHKHSYNNLDDKPSIPTQYTDELAQDAVGTILLDSSEIDFTYNDTTPSITAILKAGSIDETKLDTSVNASLDKADSAVQNLSGFDTGDLTEGTNLYYTDTRFDTRFSTKDTDDLIEGSNLYYTQARFNTAFSAKDTGDLTEGTNLYYTEARVSANTSVTSNTTHRGLTNNPHSVDKTDVGLGNVPNLDFSNASNITTGTLPSSVLPAIAITDTYTAVSEVAQLALTVQKGDICIRTDLNKSYINQSGSNTTMSDWQELRTPTDSVLSVNGDTGTVVLNQDDIGSGSTYVQTANNFTDALLTKLNGIATSANNYSLPVASTSLGGVKSGTDITVDSSGNVSVNDDSHNHLISNVDNLQTELNNKQSISEKGSANGYAELDSAGKVPSNQLPSFVDDVLEYADSASFPTTGESGKIYIAVDTNKTFRWSGTGYAEISASIALGETSTTAYRGDKGKIAYDHSQITTGNPHNLDKTDVGLENVDNTADGTKNVLSATKLTTARTINLIGDISGSVSFDGSTNVSIAATVADDSHNHIIGNVDDLQDTLDGKLDSSSYTASDVLTKIKTVDGSGSGLDADLLDGANLSTDATLSSNSDTLIASQKAVKTYVDNLNVEVENLTNDQLTLGNRYVIFYNSTEDSLDIGLI